MYTLPLAGYAIDRVYAHNADGHVARGYRLREAPATATGRPHARWRSPAGVDVSKIKARTHDCTLEVTIPVPAEAKRQRITITPTAG